MIRDAAPDDLTAVRRILVETWHAAYDASMGASRVAEITEVWHSLENLDRELRAPGSTFLVAEEGGEPVGTSLAARRDDASVARWRSQPRSTAGWPC